MDLCTLRVQLPFVAIDSVGMFARNDVGMYLRQLQSVDAARRGIGVTSLAPVIGPRHEFPRISADAQAVLRFVGSGWKRACH